MKSKKPISFLLSILLTVSWTPPLATTAWAGSGPSSWTQDSSPGVPKYATTDWYYSDTTATSFAIHTEADLAGLAYLVNGLSGPAINFEGKTITLTADIDLSSPSGLYWTPIGSQKGEETDPFKGTFDGGNNTIAGLTIYDAEASNQGLFGYVDGANIKNVSLSSASITAKNYAGILIGSAYNLTNASGCTVTNSTLTAAGFAGGLIGELLNDQDGVTIAGCSAQVNVSVDGTRNDFEGVGGYAGGLIGSLANCSISPSTISVTNSSSSGDVISTNSSDSIGVGGLIGYINNTNSNVLTVSNVAATGDVTSAGNYVGGLIGYLDNFSTGMIDLSLSHATGDITGAGNYVGGLIGSAAIEYGKGSLNISDTYARGDIQGSSVVGGLIGSASNNGTHKATSLSVSRSFATGAVTGTYHIGGLIGYLNQVAENSNTVERCYATGAVEGESFAVGGLIGGVSGNEEIDSAVSNSYAMGDVNGSNNAGGLIGIISLDGYADMVVNNVYATGSVSASDGAIGFAGGLIGAYNDSGTTNVSLSIDHGIALNPMVKGVENACNRILGYQCKISESTSHSTAGALTISNSYAFESMEIGTFGGIIAALSSSGIDATNATGAGISKAAVNTANSWNTYFDTTGSNQGVWTFGTNKLPKLGLDDAGIPMPVHLAYSSIAGGTSASYTLGNTTGINIGSDVELQGPDLNCVKVTVTTNFDPATDSLTCTAISGFTCTYSTESGILTISNPDYAPVSNFNTILSSIKFVTTATTAGTRSITFTLGDKMYSPVNDHFYEYAADPGISWTNAKVAAEAKSFEGNQGYLATITSAEENLFITEKLAANAWIGASGIVTGGGIKEWYWMTGPEAGTHFFNQGSSGGGTPVGTSYANWKDGEPNGAMNSNDNTERYAEIFCVGSGELTPGEWNDLENAGDTDPNSNYYVRGYIVEYNAPQNYKLTKTVTISAQATPFSGGGGSAPAPIAQVNGLPLVSGTLSQSTNADGKLTFNIAINQDSLKSQLSNVAPGARVTIPFTNATGASNSELNGQMLKEMENKDAVLVIQTPRYSYTLPAEQFGIDAIASAFGTNPTRSDIKVSILISDAGSQTVSVVQQAADKQHLSIVVPPVDFTITCTYQGKTMEVSRFSTFVERMIAIPSGVDATKITTGIVLNTDVTVRHVPTQIKMINGTYYAVINSLSNSAYSLVWNQRTFKDAEEHWGKAPILDMAARLVVSGYPDGTFQPDHDITRAEFTAIIVRALGLKPGLGSSTYTDVPGNEWSIDYIRSASEYGLIRGYEQGDFQPNSLITRQEAMTVLARAMTLTRLSSSMTSDEAKKILGRFDDGNGTDFWAVGSAAACVKAGIVGGNDQNLLNPKDNVTRVEVAIMVRNLLKKSALIN